MSPHRVREARQDGDVVDSRVPEWKAYFATLEEATPEQRAFYSWMELELDAGRIPNVDKSITFLFVWAYRAINHFIDSGDATRVEWALTHLRRGYPQHTSLVGYATRWLVDVALVQQQPAKAWAISDRLPASLVRTLGAQIGSLRLRPSDVKLMAGSARLTPWGTRRRELVDEHLSRLLGLIHDELGKNIVDDLADRWDGSIDSAVAADELADEVEYGGSTGTARQLITARARSVNIDPEWIRRTTTRHELFAGLVREHPPMAISVEGFTVTMSPNTSGSGMTYPLVALHPLISQALTVKAQALYREAEDLARVASGLPRIGEGWVSETELYHLLTKAFPDEKVTQHARPPWLSPQHLDVWFPTHNIGVEYQGAQHDRPIEYFGGEEAFSRQVERDQRKRRLAAENGCQLHEVREGYDVAELVAKIASSVATR